jgi:alkylation response protein AidB-like acyl-CoA dehydrogenase
MTGAEQLTDFAKERVFATLERRYEEGDFSREIWRGMGEAGFLGMTIPERYGGSGGTPVQLAEAVREFAREGCDLGMTLCWITHAAICAKSIENFGTEEQKERYLPLLTSGRWVAAAAISEAESGAHPAAMSTTATPSNGGFVLNGKKMFTTGGPVADLLIVLAVTGESARGRKEITAFLVERSLPGVATEAMQLNFVRTAPHSETTFSDVGLPADSMLGGIGEGHSSASREAFARERSAILAALSGLFASAANEIADRYRQKHEGLDLGGVEAVSWIHHLSAIDVYRLVSNELVDSAFSDIEKWRRSMDLLLYMGLSCVKWELWAQDFVERHRLERNFPLGIIMKDMKIVQVNERLLMKEGRKRFLR